ncbi:EAL domain-containing protein [Pseudomonas sp. 5P_3.1_Bac2]|uniref:EAL domain-containing response regulator n=1 Tax=Pseudomonas sp. 5P_3.1_Bac2 TaxID=2971617 RepID=UPI0021C5B8C5|nr:EAL domain-containing response regulator [Pseudomonas sp. 5P_3.1_Bac2]MCU1719454.1 EAL domain-containing response regulator [Pseudomonas sp. 5P_3.1_Bac2]
MLPLKVLVLEDHSFQRALAVGALKQIGINHIIEAADGQQALEQLQACAGADVVICDLHLPGCDGPSFLRQAYSLGLIKAVIISSSVEPSVRQGVVSMLKFLGLQFLGDLGKPMPAEQLQKSLMQYQLNRDLPKPLLPELQELPDITEVIRGLIDGEFQPYFQPKMNIRANAIQGAEVLARWQHPHRGLLTPQQFMPVINAYSLYGDLFSCLLKQGCALQQQLQRQGQQLQLAYNLHPAQLASRELVNSIRQALLEHRLPAGAVMLEVTESGLLTAPATSFENLVRLRLLGCGLAMDDFGAGYSSLRRLCELPFNQIKLDGSFVHNLQQQPRGRAIIQASIIMAEELEIDLVIEGVETEQQHAQVLALGATLTQGHIYARPMPAEQLQAYMGLHGVTAARGETLSVLH